MAQSIFLSFVWRDLHVWIQAGQSASDSGSALAPASAQTKCTHAIHGARACWALHLPLTEDAATVARSAQLSSRHVTHEQCACVKMVKGQGCGDRLEAAGLLSQTCTPSPTWSTTAHS